jgi:hypothetical protein
MNRTVLFSLAVFSLIVFGFIAYTQAIKQPAQDLPSAVVLRDDGSVAVAGFAVVDTMGIAQAPGGMYYDFALSLDPEEKQYIRANNLYPGTFEPSITTEWQDSLGRAPVLAGVWIYYRTE